MKAFLVGAISFLCCLTAISQIDKTYSTYLIDASKPYVTDSAFLNYLNTKYDSITANKPVDNNKLYCVLSELGALYLRYIDIFISEFREIAKYKYSISSRLCLEKDLDLLIDRQVLAMSPFIGPLDSISFKREFIDRSLELTKTNLSILKKYALELYELERQSYSTRLVCFDFYRDTLAFKQTLEKYKELHLTKVKKDRSYYSTVSRYLSVPNILTTYEVNELYEELLSDYQQENKRFRQDPYYYQISINKFNFQRNHFAYSDTLLNQAINLYSELEFAFGDTSNIVADFVISALAPFLRQYEASPYAIELLSDLHDMVDEGRLKMSIERYIDLNLELANAFQDVNNRKLSFKCYKNAEYLIANAPITKEYAVKIKHTYNGLHHWYRASNSDSAAYYLSEVLRVEDYCYKQFGTIPSSYVGYAHLLLDRKEFMKALEAIDKAIMYATISNDVKTLHYCQFVKGEITYKIGKKQDGISLMNKHVENIASFLGNPSVTGGIFLKFGFYLDDFQDYSKADLFYTRHFTELAKSILTGLLNLDYNDQLNYTTSFREVNYQVLTAISRRPKEYRFISTDLADMLFYKNGITELDKIFYRALQQVKLDSFGQQLLETYYHMKSISAIANKYHLSYDSQFDSIIYNRDKAKRLLQMQVASSLEKLKIESYDKVLNQLKENELLIDIVRFIPVPFNAKVPTDSVAYALMIGIPKAKRVQIVFIKYSKLEEAKLSKTFVSSISQSSRSAQSTVVKNSQIPPDKMLAYLLPSYDENLRSYKKWFVLNDGIYSNLNLSALQNATNEYLIVHHQITYFTSRNEILIKNEFPDTLSIGLMGGISYNISSSKANSLMNKNRGHYSKCNVIIPELPGAAKEVKRIKEIFRDNSVQMYTQENATRVNLSNISNKSIIHIATHGFYEPSLSIESLGQSGIYLAAAENFLNLYCGDTVYSTTDLYFEDGLVTANELVEYDFSKVWLFTLSSCLSGKGEVQLGEGVWGLQTALKIAGAKNLLLTLSEIDDKVTVGFMGVFYENVKKGQTIEEALRNTQLEIKKEKPDPHYWAPFVHYR